MNINIYQIEYSDHVVGGFDPLFERYDCRDCPEPDRREVAHMSRFYNEVVSHGPNDNIYGLLSPKFNIKANISGGKFISWVQENPGYDVYLINPFPQLSYWNYNIWNQGEIWHPGLCRLANILLHHSGHHIEVEKLPRNDKKTLLYSNYWAGTKNFWEKYISFIDLMNKTIDNLPRKTFDEIFSETSHYTPATYYPFIFERLFSTFLILNKEIRALPYEYSDQEIINKCGSTIEKEIIKNWKGLIDKWDLQDRNDQEYREILASIHGLLNIPSEISNTTTHPGFFSRLLNFLIMRRT